MINKKTVLNDIFSLYREHKLLTLFKSSSSSSNNPPQIHISCWYYDKSKILNKKFYLKYSIIKAIWREFLYEENRYYTSNAILILNDFTDDSKFSCNC